MVEIYAASLLDAYAGALRMLGLIRWPRVATWRQASANAARSGTSPSPAARIMTKA